MLIAVNYLFVLVVWGLLLLIGRENVLAWPLLPTVGIAALAGVINAAASRALLKRHGTADTHALNSRDRIYPLLAGLVTFVLVLLFHEALDEISDPTSSWFVSNSVLFRIGMNLLLLVVVRLDLPRFSFRQRL